MTKGAGMIVSKEYVYEWLCVSKSMYMSDYVWERVWIWGIMCELEYVYEW